MKYLILFFLVSCVDSDTVDNHLAAKNNPGKMRCYSVLSPPELVGNYCLKYIGNE